MQTKANGPAVSGEQVRRYRLAAHHLDRPLPPGSLTEAAGVCGVQNSPPGAWETALFARVAACTPALLRQALEEEKTLLQAWSFRGVPAVFPAAESSVFLSALAARPGEEPWIYTRGVTLALDFLGMEWDQALALVRQAASCLDGCTVQSKEELDRLLADPAGQRKVWRTAANPGVLLRGGQVAALWKPRAARGGMAVAVTPLAELSAAERRQAAAQAERYAQFRGTALTAFTVEEV